MNLRNVLKNIFHFNKDLKKSSVRIGETLADVYERSSINYEIPRGLIVEDSKGDTFITGHIEYGGQDYAGILLWSLSEKPEEKKFAEPLLIREELEQYRVVGYNTNPVYRKYADRVTPFTIPAGRNRAYEFA